MSAQLAIELGPRGITSNVIAPGVIEGTEGEKRLVTRESKSELTKKVPAGRLGTLKDMNNATVFLFAETGNYMNGTVQIGK